MLTVTALAAAALLIATGVPLVSAGAVTASIAAIVLTVEMLKSKNVIGEEAYWPALFLGLGIAFIVAGLIVKGIIPLALSITGDPIVDTFIVATITSVVTVTVAYYLPKLYSRVTGATAAPEVYSSPYLE